MSKGKLIVISGPSGAGKSSVVFSAMKGREDEFCFSTSVTTRQPRPGETDGKEYFFITREKYDRMVADNELLEHAEYVSNGYGTPRRFVEEQLENGRNVILDIEIQGAKQVAANMSEATRIFIIPPSPEELKRRLVARGTETMEVIEGRLKRAHEECAEAVRCGIYDYIVLNDNLEEAAGEYAAIIEYERSGSCSDEVDAYRFARRAHLLEKF